MRTLMIHKMVDKDRFILPTMPASDKYGKPDCQASKSDAKHVAAINAEVDKLF